MRTVRPLTRGCCPGRKSAVQGVGDVQGVLSKGGGVLYEGVSTVKQEVTS